MFKSAQDEFIFANGWMTTYSGLDFDIFNPSYKLISIVDIAHALSMICRFGGHTKKFYSVAQHSVLVSYICPPEYALEGLLHDATETYCGDLIRPIKVMMPNYQDMETGLHKAVNRAFGLRSNKKIKAIVKMADNIALITERRDLKSNSLHVLAQDGALVALKQKIRPWSSGKSELEFLKRFEELTNGKHAD